MSKAAYRSKTMRRVFMGTMLAGFLTAAFNYLVVGDDKDGIPFFDKIPRVGPPLEFHRPQSLRRRTPRAGPQPIKIPMPYNWAFPLLLGYAFGSFMFGKEGPRKLMAMMMHSALETFTPLGSEGNLAGSVRRQNCCARSATSTPTRIGPAGRCTSNPDFQKHPNAYYRVQVHRRRLEGHCARASTPPPAATRGNPACSISTRRIIGKWWINSLARKSGSARTFGTPRAVAKGKWPDANNVPLGRVVHGTDYDAANRARLYENKDRQKHPWAH